MELIRFKGEIKEKEKRPLLNNFIFGGNCGAAVDGRCASINLKSSVCVCVAGKVIMVHCTHGVNRTGYLVTR